MKPYNKKIDFLVILIAFLSTIIATVSLFYTKDFSAGDSIKTISGQTINLYGRGVYKNDSLSMAVQAKGQDLVTLFFGVPFLLYSVKLNKKETLLGRFLLTGALAYFLYAYTIYCFAESYNFLFIGYVAIMGLSFYAFVSCMTTFKLGRINENFNKKIPTKYLGISNIIFALLIGLNWVRRLAPAEVGKYLDHYTTLPIQALDLGIVLPTIIFSAIMLMRRHSWGYLLTPIITFKGLTLLIALDAMIIFMIANGVEVAIADLTIFPLYTLVVAFNFYLIVKNIKDQENVAKD